MYICGLTVGIKRICYVMPHRPRTACGPDKTDAVRRPSSRCTLSAAVSQQATREHSPNLDQTFAYSPKPCADYQQVATVLVAGDHIAAAPCEYH